MKSHLDESESRGARRLSACRAFTLVELLLVIAILAILGAMILPTLDRPDRTPVTGCMSNFHQWAVMANVYANDDRQGRLPAFGAVGSDGNPWDVSTNFVPAMVPYGMTVPMYYCPVRRQEFEADEKRSIENKLGPIKDTSVLQQFLLRYRKCKGGVVLNHAYWAPRQSSATSYYPVMDTNHCTWQGSVSPAFNGGRLNTNSDATIAKQPFITDKCGDGPLFSATSVASTNVNDISPNTGHFYRGVYSSCNLGFVDGHVETHGPANTRWQYVTGNGNAVWFY